MGVAGNKEALSVTEAVHVAKNALESHVLTLVGEVSELNNKSGYKAVYFTVKDKHSSLSCMMWKNRYQAADVDLFVGALVQMTGRFTVYAARGSMSFEAFNIALAGEGELRAKVAALAESLRREGLMDDSRKRPKPHYPEKIGLVTSPRGATVHDVLRTLRRRFPLIEVLFAGVPVEGKNAPFAMIEGIRAVVDAGAECVLLVRGGGSFESLMPFNDEMLCRAIAACPVPVLTGIGHEPDTSIADMVADLRCSTPTAAAEAISPLQGNMYKGFENAANRMHNAIQRVLMQQDAALQNLGSRPMFTEPDYLLSSEAMTLDYLGERLYHAIPANIQRDDSEVIRLGERLRSAGSSLLAAEGNALDSASALLKRSGSSLLVKDSAGLEAAGRSMRRVASTFTDRFESEIRLNALRLNDLSPLTVLGRGYSITRDQEGKVLKSVGGVAVGDTVEIEVADGKIEATVESLHAEKRNALIDE